MNYSDEYHHWSEKWEKDVEAALLEQDALKSRIVATMKSGDLLGAAEATFDYALESCPTDSAEARSYAMISTVFMQAHLLSIEANKHDSIVFDIPKLITDKTKRKLDFFYSDKKHSLYERRCGYGEISASQDAMKQDIENRVVAVEAILAEGETADPIVRNTEIRNAVRAIAEYYFGHETEIRPISNIEKRILTTLAKNLADHIEFDADVDSSVMAHETFDMLAIMAICNEGKTFDVLNASLGAFNQIRYIDLDLDMAINYSTELIKKAKLSKVAQTSILPLINMTQVALTPAGNARHHLTNPRSFKYIQRQARKKFMETYSDPVDLDKWLAKHGLVLDTFESIEPRN